MKPEENESSFPRSGNGGRQGGGAAGASSGPAERVQESAERLRETAVEKVEKAGERARERIGDARHQVVDRFRRVSSALRSTSEKLEQEDEVAAQYAAKASDGIDRFANYLSSADVGGLMREAERFARKQPAVFYGGAFVIGLAAGRFLRSSGSHDGPGRSFHREPRGFEEEPGEATTDPMGSPIPPPGRRFETSLGQRAREAFDVDVAPGGPSPGPTYGRVPGPRQSPAPFTPPGTTPIGGEGAPPGSSETAKKEKGP